MALEEMSDTISRDLDWEYTQYSPMDKHTAPIIKSILNETIGSGKEFQQILFLVIIYVYLKVLVRFHEKFFNRPP